MDNLDLLHYIEEARKSGIGDNKIREGLLQAGWPVSSVEEAMMKAPMADASQSRPKALMSKSLAVIFTVTAIAVAGYFAGAFYTANFQSFPLWPFEVSVPVPIFTPRPSPTAMPDPTADWQTYRNEEYGFEFRYPGSWEVRNGLSYEIFLNPIGAAGKFPEIQIITYTMDIAAEAGLNNLRSYWESYNMENKKIESIVVDGIEGLKVSGLSNLGTSNTPWNIIRIKLVYGDKIYHILSDNADMIFNQILSTFKFLE